MPLSVTSTAGGTAYVDVRVGTGHAIHQVTADVTDAAADIDADGNIPVGLPLKADGTLADGTTDEAIFGVVGPEPADGSANGPVNCFLDGALNRDAIEDNLGRALNANEVAALAGGGFKLV